MATYVNDLRLKEIATGDEAGTWGTSTNTNLQLIGEALGYGTQDCFASDADATTTVADGVSDPARAMYFKVTSSATLTATRTLTIAPNTVSRVMLIENATTGSQSIAISQGSGGNVTIASGQTKMVYLDGAGSGGAVVDALADLELGTITVADLTATTADINGGTIDGVTIGGSSAGAITGTTITGTSFVSSGDMTFGDNDKAIFGAGSDLQIYHDGTDNVFDSSTTFTFDGETEGKLIFKDSGTSYGRIDSNGAAGFDITSEIQDGDLRLRGNDGGSTINALTFDMSDAGSATFNNDVLIPQYIKHVGDVNTRFGFQGGDEFEVSTAGSNRLKVVGSETVLNEDGGDKDFRVESDTNTHALFVDAGNSRVGINNSSPDRPVHLKSADNRNYIKAETTGTTDSEEAGFDAKAGANNWLTGTLGSTNRYFIYDLANSTDHVRLTSSGFIYNEVGSDLDFRVESDSNTHMLFVDAGNNRVGINDSSPNVALAVGGAVYSSQYMHPAGGVYATLSNSNGTGSNTNWYKLGNITLSNSQHAKITIGGTASFSAGNPIAGETYILLRGSNATTTIEGFYYSVTEGNDGLTGVAWINTSSNAFDIYIKYNGSFAGTSFWVNADGNWVNGYADTGSATQPAGSNLLNSNWYLLTAGVERISVDTSGVVLNENGGDNDFRVESDSNTHMLFVDAGNDRVVCGATSGSYGSLFTAIGANSYTIEAKATSGATGCMILNNDNGLTTRVQVYFQHGGSTVGSITTTSSATTYNTSSDARLKENIADAEDAGAKVDAIQVRQFDWKVDGSHQDYGMVAQELVEVAPEAVTGEPDGEEMMGVDYSKLVPMLVKEIQSLRARVAQLEGA